MIHRRCASTFGFVLIVTMLTACTSVSVDVGRGTILGEGGLKATRIVLANEGQTNNLHGYVASEKGAAQKEALTAAIASDFNSTLAACNQVFTGFERQANTFRWTSFAIAMVGTVAGAIAVPALTAAGAEANKVAIAAMGGLAGAANSAQSILNDQGLSAAETVRVRDEIRISFLAALAKYLKAEDDQQRVSALQEAAVACVAYAIQSPTATIKSGP